MGNKAYSLEYHRKLRVIEVKKREGIAGRIEAIGLRNDAREAAMKDMPQMKAYDLRHRLRCKRVG